ncbi:efflux pump antibiotic resistance protein [Astrocystis sublimbata]|nr:efflux pump antibiotic resistance protein [Astrocystis sublimbata]
MTSLAATEVALVTEYPAARIVDNAGHHGAHEPAAGPPLGPRESRVDQLTEQHGAADVDAQSEYPRGAQFWLVMLTVGVALILASIDMNIVATAVPSITDHFHTVADVGWYSSAFRLTVCAFQFLFGKAFQLFSAKRLFLLANAVSIAGSLLCGTAVTSTMLVVGRAVTGVGSAGIFAGCLVILVQSTPLHQRPMFLGIMGGIEGIATLAAPLLGGAITQTLGWRWCFYISPPVGVVTLALTALYFCDRPKPSAINRMTFREKVLELDLLSNLLFLPALTSLFLALSWAGIKYPWNSAQVIGPLVVFAVLLAAFAYNQYRRGDAAALPLRIIKRRTVIAGFLFILLTNSTGNVLEYYLPTYYQTVRGFSPARSGYMLFPIIIGAIVGSFIHGAGTSTFGHYAPFMLFASIIMPVAAGLITTFKPDTSLAQLISYTALSGLAYGIGFSGPQNAVQAVLPAQDVPLGLSIMLFAQSFGPAVAITTAQVLFTNQLWVNIGDIVPGLDRSMIENNGLSEIVRSVPLTKIDEVLVGIDKSIIETWYFVVALASATIIGSLTIEWRSVKSKRT